MVKKHIWTYALVFMMLLGFTTITKTSIKAFDDETTIYAKDANGNILTSATGILQKNTVLRVENDPSKLGYGEIGRLINPDYTTTPVDQLQFPNILDYGVTITDGGYEGKLELSFYVGSSYNGMDAKVITLPSPDSDYETIMTTVLDGKVNMTVQDPSLTTQTPFVIGLPNPASTKHEEVVPNPDQSNSSKPLTLSEKTKQGRIYVKGNFSEDTSLKVTNLSKQQHQYKKLESPNHRVLAAYDITLKQGETDGSLQVTFSGDKQDANKKVIVTQLLKDGTIISSPVKVKKDGSITIKATELGAFMINEENPKQTTSSHTKYFIIGGSVIAVVLVGGILITVKRHHHR